MRMYLEHVRIQNFKGIQDISLSLTPGVNLLIGDNGVGKTSLLEAMAVGLSGMLREMKGIKVR